MLSFRRIAILVSFALTTLVLHARAFADTYSVTHVSSDRLHFAGGDDFGNYILNITSLMENSGSNCGGVINPSVCYQAHYVNGAVLTTTIFPPLWPDPNPIAGSDSCAVTPGLGFSAYSMLCSNGHMIFAGTYEDGSLGIYEAGIWTGSNPDPVRDWIGIGSIDGGFMTPNGNAYFVNGLNDTLDVALNLSAAPVPEPDSLILLGTGMLSLLGVVRLRSARSA